jgi:RNA polymerase sigma factor (sigma-70 family)
VTQGAPIREGLWRDLAPQTLAKLLRAYGSENFDLCEDAVQEALIDAYQHWTVEIPKDPAAWLFVASRHRFIDRVRRESRRQNRETTATLLQPAPVTNEIQTDAIHTDDSLLVLQLCCHPELPKPGKIALTLRAVGGLTTAQIANVYQVPEATIAQRITRAKRRLSELGNTFPRPEHAAERLNDVLDVLYVMYTEAHHTTTGLPARDADLAVESIRLVRLLRDAVPESTEVAGLLALILLTEARHPARLADDGTITPLEEQDRSRWNRQLIDEGIRLVEHAVRGTRPGPYLLQACIAALHAEAPDTASTDWVEILALYRLLERGSGYQNPTITLNRVVAQAMVAGPEVALAELAALEADHPKLPRLHAVRAHLLERADRPGEAAAAYRQAIATTLNTAEQQFLRRRLRELG